MTERSQFGLVLFAHGSRLEPANEAVRSVARELERTGSYPSVEAAFLELGKPDLAGAIQLPVPRAALSHALNPWHPEAF